ncbi:MAG TPA: biotin/lipoyl-binding protein [Candidatus Binataceae bacterium]|nr:biotin/lipoyl-binding protein [Candidatus Binataceae bacterium]
MEHKELVVRGPVMARAVGRLLGLVIVLATIVVTALVIRLYYLYPRTDDAYVRANTVGVAPHVSGPIVSLPVVDNQHVAAGALLFIVDPRPYQAALDQAQAQLTLTNLQIKSLEDTIAAARAQRTQLEANAAYAKQYLARIQPLLSRHFVTANDVYNARTNYQAAQAAVERANSQLASAIKNLGQLGDVNARRQAAQAAWVNAKLNVGYCYVRAPFDAYVTNLNIAVGQYANQGRRVLTLVDNRIWYVMANFRENFMEHIRPGMRAQVYLLSYPDHPFYGHVQGVGWALYQGNGATVAGLPRVEPTLNWVRLSQRFPVRIVLDRPQSDYPFRMGLTAIVTIQGYHPTAHRPLWFARQLWAPPDN